MNYNNHKSDTSDFGNPSVDHELNQKFWEERWQNEQTGWDIGYASPAITEFFRDFTNKDVSILIPGCGSAYEAEYLYRNGYTDITLIDIAPLAVDRLKNKFRNDPQIKVVLGDYFEWEGSYDIILEQTFFCAITPDLRKHYVKQAYDLLKKEGQIIGLLFNREFEQEGPPFGGFQTEYEKLFSPFFEIDIMEECINSVPPRKGKELFIKMIKK